MEEIALTRVCVAFALSLADKFYFLRPARSTPVRGVIDLIADSLEESRRMVKDERSENRGGSLRWQGCS
jgi:hypothetical protein